jgi:hypothetical protein
MGGGKFPQKKIIFNTVKLKIMEKYIVSIEFRYKDAPLEGYDYTSHTNTVTVGIYDDFEEACNSGNTLMETLEKKFELHEFPNGQKAKKERFSKNGGCFGGKHTLITNLAYLKTPFEFYAKITTLKYEPIEEKLTKVLNSIGRYSDWKFSAKEN